MPATEVAAARMRALETDRAVLQAAPTGYTAIVRPDGRVVAQSQLSAPEVLTATIPLHSGLTTYVRTGDGPVLTVVTLVLLAGPLPLLRRARKRRNGPAVRLIGHDPGWPR
ncbi:nitrilase-related carbon-nitrogen hydrolase [Blastococcus sp. DSM 46786]|uniref:nitrilase-related carbon-nitrogen hydrolase n=1 Tax=Blastococcus sp. DSM 46786 TaxID=1798227 RepID=UPI00244E8C59|nr:nitrilase-related carbon-nitrogen hydrolase [Blastococcus sp. DSM 46786]